VAYGGSSEPAPHDHATCREIARNLARLKGFRFAGDYDAGASYPGALYFVPTNTLIGIAKARELGIASEHDLFGGVVPHPFIASKCITHALVDDRACAPEGWSEEFAARVRAAVLRGFAAFSLDDALRAGLRLLAEGPVRVKRALGIGGRGQTVATDPPALERALGEVDGDEVSRHGIALEQDLMDVTTFSVGQARVGDLLASYCGTQRLTRNNEGELVYGGSDLLVARGDFAALLALAPAAPVQRAIEQARGYDRAAFECFAGLLASRRNYDVAQGVDAAGRTRCGVLEQSWRVGGASGAEVDALTAFHADAKLRAVRAATVERYGSDVSPPANATVYFHGTDARVGPLTKYALTQPYAHS
jgi:hypothetical protein